MELESKSKSMYQLQMEQVGPFDHGVPGHLGYRCVQCARVAETRVEITQDSTGYWQGKQISWQEDCDEIMTQFDEDVAIHFPIHIPAVATGSNVGESRCTTCPVKPILPVKPNPPIERRRYG